MKALLDSTEVQLFVKFTEFAAPSDELTYTIQVLIPDLLLELLLFFEV